MTEPDKRKWSFDLENRKQLRASKATDNSQYSHDRDKGRGKDLSSEFYILVNRKYRPYIHYKRFRRH